MLLRQKNEITPSKRIDTPCTILGKREESPHLKELMGEGGDFLSCTKFNYKHKKVPFFLIFFPHKLAPRGFCSMLVSPTLRNEQRTPNRPTSHRA